MITFTDFFPEWPTLNTPIAQPVSKTMQNARVSFSSVSGPDDCGVKLPLTLISAMPQQFD